MMPRVTKRMISGRKLKTVACPSLAVTVKPTGTGVSKVKVTTKKSIKSETTDIKSGKPPSNISKKVLKPSMSRDFERNMCQKEEEEEEEEDMTPSSCRYSAVIGCDEAGRGPLCGPVVAAAAWVHADALIEHGIADSKATTETQREATYDILVNHPGVKYTVVRIEHDEIDKINILQASLKAMRMACMGVLEQLQELKEPLDPAECLCLVDGNKCPQDMPVKTKCVIKGDSLAFSIAAASIIAKISRDRIMTAYAQEYPLYGLAQHKGYPTLSHRTVLSKHGPSPIHRMSYRPVYESVKGYVKPPATVSVKKIKAAAASSSKKEVKTGAVVGKQKKAVVSSVKTKKINETKRRSSSSSSKPASKQVIDSAEDTNTARLSSSSSSSSSGVGVSGRVTRSSTRKRKEQMHMEVEMKAEEEGAQNNMNMVSAETETELCEVIIDPNKSKVKGKRSNKKRKV